MRMIFLLAPLLAANASAAEQTAVQAQPLLLPVGLQTEAKAMVKSTAVSSPKIHSTEATLNSDGTLTVGCVERPNPHAAKSPIRTISPEPQQ